MTAETNKASRLIPDVLRLHGGTRIHRTSQILFNTLLVTPMSETEVESESSTENNVIKHSDLSL